MVGDLVRRSCRQDDHLLLVCLLSFSAGWPLIEVVRQHLARVTSHGQECCRERRCCRGSSSWPLQVHSPRNLRPFLQSRSCFMYLLRVAACHLYEVPNSTGRGWLRNAALECCLPLSARSCCSPPCPPSLPGSLSLL